MKLGEKIGVIILLFILSVLMYTVIKNYIDFQITVPKGNVTSVFSVLKGNITITINGTNRTNNTGFSKAIGPITAVSAWGMAAGST